MSAYTRVGFRFVLASLAALFSLEIHAAVVELSPAQLEGPRLAKGATAGRYSSRTLSLGLEIDRDGFRLVAFTLKARPFVRSLTLPVARPIQDAARTQIEVVLLGSGGARYTQRVDVGPLCLTHGSEAESHVQGDTIRVHRDTFVVEVPEIDGFDRVEVAVHESEGGLAPRRSLGVEPLAADRFAAAGSAFSYSDLAIANASEPERPSSTLAAGVVHWPAEYGDTDIYKLYGNAAEVDRRINVVIVPDGYTYAQKALMQSNADSVVNFMRSKTPFKEHDPLINYTLVYAYSTDTGTDQCDCMIIKNTAMGSRFPNDGYPCGNSGNRCLFYGTACDTGSSGNIVQAELRAPAKDVTVVMVNTTRYGGCGGVRAVYSAGASGAVEVAVHELGHTLGGLADEYGGVGCGGSAGEVNTSVDPFIGAWPEWIEDVGPPRVGAQYYDDCLYRPENSCEMRTLGPQFCRVCQQHLSLQYFGHWRVDPTAPIESASPASPMTVDLDLPVDLSVATRLAAGPGVTTEIFWRVQGPNDPGPLPVATDTPSYQHVFMEAGSHTVTCEVLADTNFIKKEKFGSNVDVATWDVSAVILPPPGEVSAPGSEPPLAFSGSSTLVWQEASASGSSRFNVYRGTVDGLPAGDYGPCLEPRLLTNGTQDAGVPPSGTCWTYLVTGRTSGGEGPMGNDHGGTPRSNTSPCASSVTAGYRSPRP